MKIVCAVTLVLGLSLVVNPLYAGGYRAERDVMAPAVGGEARFGAEVRYWFSEMDGEVQITSGSITGTTIDFKDDLDMDEDEGIPNIELWYKLGEASKISLSYFKVEHEGDKILERTVTFKGINYTLSTVVESELETSLIELMYERGLIYEDMWRVSFLAGIKYLGFDASISSPIISKSEDIDGPVPVIGLGGYFNLPVEGLSVEAEISGVSADVSDVEGSLVDLSVSLNYDFTENWRASVGYRSFDVDVESDDDEANFTLSGPTLCIIGRF